MAEGEGLGPPARAHARGEASFDLGLLADGRSLRRTPVKAVPEQVPPMEMLPPQGTPGPVGRVAECPKALEKALEPMVGAMTSTGEAAVQEAREAPGAADVRPPSDFWDRPMTRPKECASISVAPALHAAEAPRVPPQAPADTRGDASGSTATLPPPEPKRQLATVGTAWKAPPPGITSPKAPPQGVDGPCSRAGPPVKAPPPNVSHGPLATVAEEQVSPRGANPNHSAVPTPTTAFDSRNLPAAYWLPSPATADARGNASEPTATSQPAGPARQLAAVGVSHKAPPPGINPPSSKAPPSKAPQPGSGDRAGGATEHAPPDGAIACAHNGTDNAKAADTATAAARQRSDEIERGARALGGNTKRVVDWDKEAYARLERYRDAVGREWQYDPLTYECMYVRGSVHESNDA